MAIRCLFSCFLNKKYHLVGTFRWEAKKYDTVLSLFIPVAIFNENQRGVLMHSPLDQPHSVAVIKLFSIYHAASNLLNLLLSLLLAVRM